MAAMRWRRLGRLFDPREHALPAGCREYAQSPQALVFDDFVRVYFSTRSVDPANGKFLSRVCYADFDRGLRTLRGVSAHEVLPLGGLGTFDEHGIFPFSVTRDGERVLAFTTGWSRRVSVSVETGIGLATSRDGGERFERVGTGPVLGASLHQPCLVADGFVRRIEGRLRMWYIFGTGWRAGAPDAAPDRTYKIGQAVSDDGIDWVRESAPIVADRLGPDECQALPSVFAVGSRYHMVFCYRESFDFRNHAGRGYRIGHAWSDDLVRWSRDDDAMPLAGGSGDWDGAMQCYPNVVEIDGRVLMLYNGDAFGRHGFGVAELETVR
jgi:hypothetical protein